MCIPNYVEAMEKIPVLFLTVVFAGLSVVALVRLLIRKKSPYGSYLNYVWYFFLLFLIAEYFSFYLASWGWGIFCFMTLREYFSLVDLRLQDRAGVLAAYLSIPFMMHFIHTDWYGMFIISIPVYTFLFIPALISITSRQTGGAINAIGTIIFGLMLFVFSIGHLAYLAYYSSWMAATLVLCYAVCDSVTLVLDKWQPAGWSTESPGGIVLRYGLATPFTITLIRLLMPWTHFTGRPAVMLGALIPALVILGNHTIAYYESDLGITRDNIRPGRGLLIDNLKSILFTTPIAFHYIRYFSDVL